VRRAKKLSEGTPNRTPFVRSLGFIGSKIVAGDGTPRNLKRKGIVVPEKKKIGKIISSLIRTGDLTDHSTNSLRRDLDSSTKSEVNAKGPPNSRV